MRERASFQGMPATRTAVRTHVRRWSFGLLIVLVAAPLFAQPPASETPGLVVERIRLPRAPTAPVGDRMLTLVRVDLRRYRLTVLAGQRDGAPRTLDRWVSDFGLTGGINAGMFLPNRRPVGTLIHDGVVLGDRRPQRFDAAVGFDPIGRSPAIAIGGTGCRRSQPSLRSSHRSVVQGFRMMVDCEGRARPWPTQRRYSAAAFGADSRGRAVFLHVRTPYSMEILNRMLAAPELGLRGIVYMEGGPEASLIVEGEGQRVREIGSWEDGFWENDGNDRLWDLPNVIGFRARRAAE